MREDHPSVPNNPLLAESLYLARSIEKAGSSTQAMIALCREADLPDPDFGERQDSFVVTLWRDWLTDDVIASLGRNERQAEAVSHVKNAGGIANADNQKLTRTLFVVLVVLVAGR